MNMLPPQSMLNTDGLFVPPGLVEACAHEAPRLEQLIKRYERHRATLNAIVSAADKMAEVEGRCLRDEDDAAAQAAEAVVDAALSEICHFPVSSLEAIQRKTRWLQLLNSCHGELQDRPDLLVAALASMSGLPGGVQ